MLIDAMVRRIGIACLAGVLVASAGSALADPNWRQNGNSNAAESARAGGQCVRQTDWMRRNHMALLKHDRDLTVLEGIRTVDGSLSECVACHANKHDGGSYMAVNGEEQFCAGCHEFAGVSLDCFQCHATVPTE